MSTLLTLLGIVVATALTYLFTRSHEHEKHFRLLQTGAYADYLRCVAEAAHLSLRSDEAELFARAADSKTRICLYGSKDVVTLLAPFERDGGIIGDSQQRETFVRLVLAMRGDSKVNSSELDAILFREMSASTSLDRNAPKDMEEG